MKTLSLAVLFTSTALIPAAFGQTNSNAVDIAAIDDSKICVEMLAFVEENDTDDTGVTIARANDIAAGEDPQMCRQAFELASGAEMTVDAEATADIKVAVPEPTVQVEQRAPQVSVDQPQPTVDVTPGRPIVTVNQAEPVVQVITTPPKVTIDMPKPEILVEMPDPTVDVSMAQPRVTVDQPEPRVTVTQGEVRLDVGDKEIADRTGEANVQVQQENATVRVQEAESSNVSVADVQPEVRFNTAQPRVEVSETGEPEIQFNQSGEANVRFRQMNEDETRQAAAARREASGQEAEMQTAARTQDESADAQSFASNTEAGAEVERHTLTVAEIRDEPIFGATGDTIGDVEEIVQLEGNTYVIVGAGGLLGLGEKQIAIALDDIHFRGDRLVSPTTTEDTVEEIAEEDMNRYQPLGNDESIYVRVD